MPILTTHQEDCDNYERRIRELEAERDALRKVKSAAKAFVTRVEELEIQWDQEKLTITISVGLATMEKNNYRTHQDLFKAADEQMYVAKRSGRNQVRYKNHPNLEIVTSGEA